MSGALSVLFFSRGRGKGHAVPDLAIVEELRSLCSSICVTFASYSTGAEVLAAAGERSVDLKLPEGNSFVETLVKAARLVQKERPLIVVSHEELAALPAATISGIPAYFLTHWFGPPQDPYVDALCHADQVLFMESENLFPEPRQVEGRIKYVGPVLRRFRYRPSDRARARTELGFCSDDILISMLPGSPSEDTAPTCDLVLEAFDLLDRPNKYLVWIAGKDRDRVSRRVADRRNVRVLEVDWQLDRLMVASDLAITKATYNIGKELSALGVPSIALSHGKNFIDDLFSRSLIHSTFLWAKDCSPSTLAGHIEASLVFGLSPPDVSLLDGTGARAVATALAEHMDKRSSARKSLKT